MGLLTFHVEFFIWLSSNQLYCSVFIIGYREAGFLPLFRQDRGDETRALIKKEQGENMQQITSKACAIPLEHIDHLCKLANYANIPYLYFK